MKFSLPISLPRFKSIIVYQHSPKIKLFFKKMQNFQRLGLCSQTPIASGGWGLRPLTPKTVPPIASFWLRAKQLFTVYNYMLFRSFVLSNLFLIVQLQPYDVNYRCMPNA